MHTTFEAVVTRVKRKSDAEFYVEVLNKKGDHHIEARIVPMPPPHASGREKRWQVEVPQEFANQARRRLGIRVVGEQYLCRHVGITSPRALQLEIGRTYTARPIPKRKHGGGLEYQVNIYDITDDEPVYVDEFKCVDEDDLINFQLVWNPNYEGKPW